MTHIIEQKEYLGKILVYHFCVEATQYARSYDALRTTKWLNIQDWIQIYNKLETLLDKCEDRNLKDLPDSEDFTVADYISVNMQKITISPEYQAILKIADSKKMFPVIVKVFIKKLNASLMMKRIAELELMLSRKRKQLKLNRELATNGIESHHEYDPVQDAPTSLSEVVPYKPSKVNKPESTGDLEFLERNEAYSPKPIGACEISPEKHIDQIDNDEPIPTYKPSKISPSCESKSTRKKDRTTKRTKSKVEEDLFGSEDSDKSPVRRSGRKTNLANYAIDVSSANDTPPADLITKRKRNCQRTKETESEWLSSKKLKESDGKAKPETIKQETTEEDETQFKETIAVKLEEFNQLFGETERPPRDHVLHLEHLNIEHILETFPDYKHTFDEIFKNFKRSKCPIVRQALNGADFLSANSVISHEKMLKMLHCLDKNFKINLKNGSSVDLTDLFMKQMMPEWLIELFKKEHTMGRDETIKQMRLQNVFENNKNNDKKAKKKS